MNGKNGYAIVDMILKVSQALVIPLVFGLVWLMGQLSSFDRKLAAIESRMSSIPNIERIAVMEDRVDRNMRKLIEMEAALFQYQREFLQHQSKSTYDNPYKNKH